MDKKNSFLLYTEQKEVIDELNNEEAGELIKAIYAYAAGEEVNLRKDLHLVFIPIRQQIDRNNAKYDDFKKKQSENGKKGGRPATNDKNKNPKNPKNPTLFSKTQKSLNVNVNVNDNVNDNANDNANDNDNVNDNVTSIVPIEVKEKKETNNNSVIISKEKKVSNNFISPSLEAIKEYIEENKYPLNAEDFYDFYSAKGWMVGKNKMKDWKAAVRMWSRRDRDTGGNKNRNVSNTPSPYVYNGLA